MYEIIMKLYLMIGIYIRVKVRVLDFEGKFLLCQNGGNGSFLGLKSTLFRISILLSDRAYFSRKIVSLLGIGK